MLQLNKTFYAQSALASFCKKGEYKSIEGVNEERAKHYRQLVYNVIDDTLQSAFPLTLALLSEEEWNFAVDLFFSAHAAQTPILWRLPEEFVDFSNSLEFSLKKKYPFISELLLFEWMEVKIFMMEDISSEFSTQGNMQSDKLVLNPESHFLHFNYPVHLKKANEISEEDKGNYFLVMYREPQEKNVLISHLSPFLLATLEILSEEPQSVEQLLKKVSNDFNLTIDEELKKGTHVFYQNILETKLILGFKN